MDEQAKTDPHLQVDLDWALQLHDRAASMPLVNPPELLRQKLRQQFRDHNRSMSQHGSGPLQLRAKLIFDSRTQELAGSLRAGVDDGSVVHHVWRTGVADIMLDIRELSDEQVRLDGQVLLGHATSAPIFEARATSPDGSVAVAAGDRLGRFQVEVPGLDVDLLVTNGELTVQIPLGSVS